MIILHCLTKKKWEAVKDHLVYGEELLTRDGFIHCSSISYFWRVAPNFRDIKEDLVLLCIDLDKLNAEVKWEDGSNCGREYPHVYGVINRDAIIDVLPYLRDENGDYVRNPEFAAIENA